MKNLIRAIVPEFRRLFRYILIVSALVYDWKGVLRFFIIGLLIRLLNLLLMEIANRIKIRSVCLF